MSGRSTSRAVHAERVERAFAYIRRRIEAGVPPTCEEVGAHLDMSAVGAWKIINAIIAQGRLARAKTGSRMLSLADEADLTVVGTEALRAELARRGATFDALAAPRPIHGGKPCAAHHCTVHVQPGRLFCLDHWRALTPELRTAILNAFNHRHHQAYSEALESARDHLGGFTRVLERAE